MTGIQSPSRWRCALELNPARKPTSGSADDLARAIRQGADLRVYTEFLHEEHISPFGSPQTQDPRLHGLIREIIDFRVGYLIDGRHAAGITMLRQPLEPTNGFNGTQPRMSFFLYNMDASQACASLLLDEGPHEAPGRQTVDPVPDLMPKMSVSRGFDQGSAGPSRNFIYDMEVYRYFVAEDWQEILAHDENGRVLRGSIDLIEEAQIAGRELKVAIRDLCADLGNGPSHEVFSLLGSSFFHTGVRTHEALTHPLVRVAPAVPLAYGPGNWDVAWVSVRTDGWCVLRRLDPWTRKFRDEKRRLALRWFVR